MFKILKKEYKAQNAVEFTVYAPNVAKHCKSGQFIILRVDEEGERVPFTICDYDRKDGTVTILVQTVGFTTKKMATLNEGDSFADFVGPLGNATDLSEYKKIVLVGGGIGTAVIYPQSKQLFNDGKAPITVLGARNKELVMYEEGFKKYSQKVMIMTDDGSYGEKGFVTDALKKLLDTEKDIDCVFAVGPLPMMRAVCNLTKTYGVKTIVSMNSIMVDGTGMCGGCRLTVNGETKYACVHGPEFDGHQIDFDEAINRSRIYKVQEEHSCRLLGGKN